MSQFEFKGMQVTHEPVGEVTCRGCLGNEVDADTQERHCHRLPPCYGKDTGHIIFVRAKTVPVLPLTAEHKAEFRDPPSIDRLGAARTADPATSKEAAAKVGGGKLIDLVLLKLQENNGWGELRGMTGKEIANELSKPLNSITPRFAQLRRKGLIHAAGKRDKQIVWRIGNGVS